MHIKNLQCDKDRRMVHIALTARPPSRVVASGLRRPAAVRHDGGETLGRRPPHMRTSARPVDNIAGPLYPGNDQLTRPCPKLYHPSSSRDDDPLLYLRVFRNNQLACLFDVQHQGRYGSLCLGNYQLSNSFETMFKIVLPIIIEK